MMRTARALPLALLLAAASAHGEGPAAPVGAAAKVRQQAAEDFRQDNPEAASLADERLAEKREERAVRQALDNLSGEDPEAPFEASEEELAAQKPRQAVHDARDAEEVV